MNISFSFSVEILNGFNWSKFRSSAVTYCTFVNW